MPYYQKEMDTSLRNKLHMLVREFPADEIPERYMKLQDPAMPPVNVFPVKFYCKNRHDDWVGPYSIDQIYYIQRGSARRAGGSGIQYKVRIGNVDRDLFHDNEWFFEKPEQPKE